MAYQINKTDGTIVSTVADGQTDTLSTDLTLIGKNYSGFGEALNENFIKLLENFSNSTRPTHPIRGQIWFDTSELKLKVYSGTQFLPVSSATIANTQPTSLGVGDLWFNNVDSQLYFFDGNTAILLGPSYATSQGVSGLKVASILDTLNQTRVITYLYNNGILLGIFSKDSFTPKITITGFTGSITPGFNAGNLAGIKFNVTCTNSESLGGIVASTYVRKDTSNSINGLLQLTSNDGVVIGSAGEGSINISTGNVVMSNTAAEKNLIFNVKRGFTQEDAIVVEASTRAIGLYSAFPTSEVTIGGSLTIGGNLTVTGSTTTVNTEVLTIEDKNIVLGSAGDSTSSSDALADGGGIILRGTTDHEFLWNGPQTSWDSTEHINLVSGKEFKINGITVLSGTSLGSGITAIPGVTSFGTQNVINIGPGLPPVTRMRLLDTTISTVSNNYDIILDPDGTGNIVLNSSARIRLLVDPVDQQDAATKEYVDAIVETRPILLSLDLSDGQTNVYIINNILNVMAPPGVDYRDGMYARILCSVLSNSTTLLDINPLVAAGTSTATFVTPGPGTAPAVTNISVGPATVAAAPLSVIRFIKTFRIIVGVWQHQSDSTTF
jgi:hypothetical protein